MTLWQLLGSFAAISVLAALAFYLFPVKFGLNPKAAQEALHHFAPDHSFNIPILSEDGKTALALAQQDPKTIGFVRLLGDKMVCRLITTSHNIGCKQQDNNFTLLFDDFVQPTATFRLSHPDAAPIKATLCALGAVSMKGEANNAP